MSLPTIAAAMLERAAAGSEENGQLDGQTRAVLSVYADMAYDAGLTPIEADALGEPGSEATEKARERVKAHMLAFTRRQLSRPIGEEVRHVFGKCVDTSTHKVVPCPSAGSSADKNTDAGAKEGTLKARVQQLGATPEGKETLARGHQIGEKIKGAIGAGVKAAISALDDESMGGASYLLQSIKKLDAGGAMAGAHAVFRSIFTNVYEEVFEAALSQHAFPMAHAAGVVAAKGAVKVEQSMLQAIAWAWKKLGAREALEPWTAEELALFQENEPAWTDADKKFARALAAIGAEALRTVYKAAGVDPGELEIDEKGLGQKIIDSLLRAA